MLSVINFIVSWTAVGFRAGGMLAKNPNKIKLLVSAGNLGWLISGILTANIPLVASNGICLAVMIVELVRKKRKKSEK